MSGRRRPPKPPALKPPNFVLSPIVDKPPTPKVEESLNLSNEINTQLDDTNIVISSKNMKKIYELGSGFYGFVEAMRHEPTGHIFAVKRIGFTAESQDRRKLLNDLDVSMRSATCEFVIHSYGALLNEGEIWIVMEVMDLSLDKLYKLVYAAGGHIPESLLVYICRCVVTALEYLHVEAHVIHRDVKPSNILADKDGRVKVCDFGISGNLVNSLAKTNVGSEQYLAPERIIADSEKYDIRADVWSLGLTLLELAVGAFPYGRWANMFQQIKMVVEQPSPQLPQDSPYSQEFRQLVSMCLEKPVARRATYSTLLQLPLIAQVDMVTSRAEMATYVRSVLEPTASSAGATDRPSQPSTPTDAQDGMA